MVPDLAADLPGRGTWITASREAVAAASRGAFARSQKRGVTAPIDLSALVADLLERRCCDALGLARKSGALVTGFEKVADTVRAGRAAGLVEASDGAADGRSKLFKLASAAIPGLPVMAPLTVSQLSLALGQENVVHACLTNRRHAARLARDVHRLGGFRTVMPADWVCPEGLAVVSGALPVSPE